MSKPRRKRMQHAIVSSRDACSDPGPSSSCPADRTPHCTVRALSAGHAPRGSVLEHGQNGHCRSRICRTEKTPDRWDAWCGGDA